MDYRRDQDASSSSRTALPFGSASAYNDTFPSPSSTSPLSNYRNRDSARKVAGVSEETLRASVRGKGESDTGGLLEVTAETCYQLSLFKAIMNEYRRFDDMIIVRLNRASAARRDENRSQGLPPTQGQDDTCLKLWKEMIAGWQHRQRLLNFCTATVEQDLREKQRLVQGQEPELDRRPITSFFEEEVLANQLKTEQRVEAIVRRRTVDAFKGQCRFFVPPEGGDAKTWWDLANQSR
ncbi:hypothetical protein NliqN6_5029 [Naganishia liquefaciens]|uniref:Uncharacterized protein n=1 Tax=Naganishia liquefaciens TaxID=104408 RepID=A0A8H3TWW5_9TREE|nr:hypothetical protein NliqN6_5029 [Naganishia liquefaciens]